MFEHPKCIGKRRIDNMKQKLIALLTVLFATMQITSYAQTNQSENMNKEKILVAFFSRAGENYAVGHIEKGNTHIMADMIAAETGGDLFQIEPVTPYPEDYMKCTEVAKQELEAKARPAIQGDAAVEDYNVIFIGYPIWWDQAPRIINTFIESHDLEGKTLIPFATSGGSGITNSVRVLRKTYSDLNWQDGKLLNGASRKVIQNWADNIMKMQ